MRPKQRQAKIARAQEHLQAARAELADFFWMDSTPPEVSWVLQATKLLEVVDNALVHADYVAASRQRGAAP